ncbi:MAG: sigma-70 family RNA polymerase sigma factor [candidate division Zixibacteria bacterium]|nr:sigma-70 family RNA polymerase sigma factor [candidate division Zixibacteria bacterium]
MSEYGDQELVKDCLNGNTEAFGELIDRYQKPIFNVALRFVNDYDEAQDITQTTFVRAFERLAGFRSELKFFSWLYRIAVNEALNTVKRLRTKEELTEIAGGTPTPEESLCRSELETNIEEALMELQIDYRMAIVMRHFADLSYREMSFVLDIPVKTVKSRLFSARRLLCDILMQRGILAYE